MRLIEHLRRIERSVFVIITFRYYYFLLLLIARSYLAKVTRARVSIRPRMRNDKCTCMRIVHTVHTYHRRCRVVLCERSKRPTKPTDQPGFIITRWHRAIRAGRSLTFVKHVGIIARTRGSFNISISALASYYPRKSRRGPARTPA